VALLRSFKDFNLATSDLFNDFLKLYQKFDTPAVQQRRKHAGSLSAHFDVRADQRLADISAMGIGEVPHDLLTTLLSARDPTTGAALSRDDVNTSLKDMMSAGHDGTSSTIACMLTMLAANPVALAAVTAEVDAVVDGNGGSLPSTVAAAKQLTKTDDAIKETLRLYPAVLVVQRTADVGGELRRASGAFRGGGGRNGATSTACPLGLGGGGGGGSGSRAKSKGGGAGSATSGDETFQVPEGARMWISPYVMGRSPEHWGGDAADTATYRPERFAEAEASGTSLDAYMPFGGGPRVCLGSRLAMLQGKVLVAAILRNFDLVRMGSKQNGCHRSSTCICTVYITEFLITEITRMSMRSLWIIIIN